MNPEPQLHLLSPTRVAEMAGVGLSTVYDWMKAGKLPHYTFGRIKRISQSDLKRFLQEHRVGRPEDRHLELVI